MLGLAFTPIKGIYDVSIVPNETFYKLFTVISSCRGITLPSIIPISMSILRALYGPSYFGP